MLGIALALESKINILPSLKITNYKHTISESEKILCMKLNWMRRGVEMMAAVGRVGFLEQ
jgi:hypothetical protein